MESEWRDEEIDIGIAEVERDNLIAMLGAILGFSAFAAQVILTYQTREVSALSYGLLFLTLSSLAVWLYYSVVIDEQGLIFTIYQSLFSLLIISLIVMKFAWSPIK